MPKLMLDGCVLHEKTLYLQLRYKMEVFHGPIKQASEPC